MLSFLPPIARGVVAACLLVANTLLWCGLLFLFALLKWLLRVPGARAAFDHVLNGIATRWIAGNSAWMSLTQRTEWDVDGIGDLDPRGWYLVNCNHQSWVDILVLQHLLNRRIPLLKFFLKRQLLYVPVMGLAWWALDFPFMRRHSQAYLKQHPEKRREDIDEARRACEKFALVPTSVMNFAEGTRFTRAKHADQRSPYRHLLKPKAGALGLALSVLGERFQSFVDVTIVYPGGAPTFWEFMCGRVPRVVVRAKLRTVPAEFVGGDYESDSRFRKGLQRWLQEQWREKDALIDGVLGGTPPAEAQTNSPTIASPSR
ncbi:MAG: acyltransferase [Burkholderiaceae bacterium]